MSTCEYTTIRTSELIDHLVDAVDAIRVSAADAPIAAAWERAVDTAWDVILASDSLDYDVRRSTWRVASATRPGVVYEANGACQCEQYTRRQGACWHRAGARLIARAIELRDLADEILATQIAEGVADYTPEMARRSARALMSDLRALARRWDETAARVALAVAAVDELYA